MTLPIDPAHAAALVADDDEFFRMAAVAILRSRLGFAATIEATSLTEALCHAGSAAPPIGLALVDLRMPGVADMNSLSVVRATLPAARVVVVSASRRRADVLGALGIGAHGYVWKAAGAGELEKSLRAVLAGEVSIPAFVAEFEADPPPLRDAARTASAGTLTDRQRDVLRHIVQGASNKEIARALNLGEGTVKVHVAGILKALGAPNRAAAAVLGAALMTDGHSA